MQLTSTGFRLNIQPPSCNPHLYVFFLFKKYFLAFPLVTFHTSDVSCAWKKMSIEILKVSVKKTNFGKLFLQTCVSKTNKKALFVFVSNVKQQKQEATDVQS